MISANTFLALLLIVPFVIAILCFLCHFMGQTAKVVTPILHIIGLVVLLFVSLILVLNVGLDGTITSENHWLLIDSLGAIFLGVLAVISFLIGIYAIGYMKHECQHGAITKGKLCNFYGLFHLFIFTMLLVITTNNLIVMWAAIEATTLSSAFLVGLYGKRPSLEAAWKYIIICSVGVAFGLYGTVLVYANAVNVLDTPSMAIFWTYVLQHAKVLDPTLMYLAFIFVLIGFGTKTGLFPMHAWLPDAHSEAPSPISALLSAVLLNCALLVIIRYYMIIHHAIGDFYPQTVLLVFGLLSIIIAAFFIIVQKDMKRLLAYSSMENMGLIAVAIGIGGPLGIMAAILHIINHSLGKSLLFCGSGNVLMKYNSREMGVVKGMLKVAPFSAILILLGALALGGMPPFSLFTSEFMTFSALLNSHHLVIGIILLILLTIVLCGLVRMVANMMLGDKPDNIEKGEVSAFSTIPMLILVVLLLVMGLHIPNPVVNLVEKATQQVLGDTTMSQQTFDISKWQPSRLFVTSASQSQSQSQQRVDSN